MTKLFGVAGHENVQGESVQKLDVLSNELFINMLKSSYTVCAMVSEENTNIIEVSPPCSFQPKVYIQRFWRASNLTLVHLVDFDDFLGEQCILSDSPYVERVEL